MSSSVALLDVGLSGVEFALAGVELRDRPVELGRFGRDAALLGLEPGLGLADLACPGDQVRFDLARVASDPGDLLLGGGARFGQHVGCLGVGAGAGRVRFQGRGLGLGARRAQGRLGLGFGGVAQRLGLGVHLGAVGDGLTVVAALGGHLGGQHLRRRGGDLVGAGMAAGSPAGRVGVDEQQAEQEHRSHRGVPDAYHLRLLVALRCVNVCQPGTPRDPACGAVRPTPMGSDGLSSTRIDRGAGRRRWWLRLSCSQSD